MGIFGRKTKVQKTNLMRVALDVAPTWWSRAHHRPGGAMAYLFEMLNRTLAARRIEPLELHFTMDKITVLIAPDLQKDGSYYETLSTEIRDYLTDEVTTDRSDFREEEPATLTKPEKEEASEAATAAVVTREQLEVKLREKGFVPRSELSADTGESIETKVDDADIWTDRSGTYCAQFDERSTAKDGGKLRWMSRDIANVEQLMTYDHVSELIDKLFVPGAVLDAPPAAGDL